MYAKTLSKYKSKLIQSYPFLWLSITIREFQKNHDCLKYSNFFLWLFFFKYLVAASLAYRGSVLKGENEGQKSKLKPPIDGLKRDICEDSLKESTQSRLYLSKSKDYDKKTCYFFILIYDISKHRSYGFRSRPKQD